MSALGIVAACGGGGTAAPPALGEGSDASMDVKMQPEAAPMEAAPPPPTDGGCVDGSAGFSVSATSITFSASDAGAGFVPCGTAAPSQSVTLTNNTCGPVTFNTTLTNGASMTSTFMVGPQMGTIPAGQTQLVTVTPLPIPATNASVAPDFYGATLTIVGTVGGVSQSYPLSLHETAQGVILVPSTMTHDFMGVPIGESAEYQLSITNNGNMPAHVGLATGTSFFTVADALPDGGTAPPPLVIGPGQPAGAQITFTPTVVQPYTDTLVISAPNVPLCAALPMPIALTGTGTTGVSVTPTDIKFGNVQCNQAPASPVTVQIKNTGAAATYTPTLGQGTNSYFTLQDDMGNALTLGTAYPLPQASTVSVSVVPKDVVSPAPTGNDALADTLVITTTAMGDAAHSVSLHETAQGAVLTLTPASISVSTGTNTTTFSDFTVGNTGNYPVSFTVTASTNAPGTPNTFSSNLTSGTLSANVTKAGVLSSVGPPAMVQYTGWLTLQAASGSILCQDVPVPMPLSVTGQ